jgi:hypothetical protein
MAYKIFANGNPLQASELNVNLMQQAIAVFTDATARDAAISVPVNGQFAYLTGTSNLTKYTGAAWVSAIADTSTTVSEQATSRTILAGDANSFIYATAAITITVDDVLAVGETINFVQNVDAAPITFAAGAGVTLNSKAAALLTGGQFAGASITKKATNSYYLVGDLA